MRACESKQRVFHREGLHQVQEGRLGETRNISRPPEIDVAAEAPDGLRHCERSREVGDYRLYVDRVDASEALSPDSYERFHSRKPSRSVKEQRPGLTGLVKRVDIVAETRVVVVDTWGRHLYGDVLCVGDLQCDRFSCFIFIIKHCSINFIGVMFYCDYMFNIRISCLCNMSYIRPSKKRN